MWGDGALWYRLAEANGLSADAALAEGQALAIPLTGPASRNNADMFRPYDTASAVGDLNPTSTKPPKKKGGLLGKILIAVIAIAVTILTQGTFTAALGPVLGGMATAATASVVSQGVGVATGIQDKFSWKGVAMAAITAGVTGGIDATGVFSGITNSTLRAGVTAVASSTISQGIGVATGLQPKFDWVGVAAAGVGAMAGNAIGNAAAKQLGLSGNNPIHGAVYKSISTGASLIANAATRSVAQGTSFGDNIIAALPDAIAYNARGQVASERSVQVIHGAADIDATITNSYDAGSSRNGSRVDR